MPISLLMPIEPIMSTQPNLGDLLFGKELIVTDFADTLVDGKKYVRSAKISLAKHGGPKALKKAVKEKNLELFRVGRDLYRNHEDLPSEVRIEKILQIVKDSGEDIAESWGKNCARYIDDNVVKFLSMCYDINHRIKRALISIDDQRVVEPTLYEMTLKGLPIHKYIVNQVLTVGGKLTDVVVSYAEGVANWSGEAIRTAHDKLDAFIALIYPYHPSQILYINDDADQEEEIDRYMKENGGTVIKASELGRFLAPTLI